MSISRVSGAALALVLASLPQFAKAAAMDRASQRFAREEQIAHNGRRKPRRSKGELRSLRPFPCHVRKPERVLPAPPNGHIYVRDHSKSGMVPKLVRR